METLPREGGRPIWLAQERRGPTSEEARYVGAFGESDRCVARWSFITFRESRDTFLRYPRRPGFAASRARRNSVPTRHRSAQYFTRPRDGQSKVQGGGGEGVHAGEISGEARVSC